MRARGATVVIAAGVLAGGLALAGWFGYYAVWLPRRLAREFVAVAASGGVERVRARIAPDRRGAYDDAALSSWGAALHAHGRVEWIHSGLGTSRQGRRTCRAAARVHDPPGGARELEASFVLMDGVWYVDSFSLGERTGAR